MQKVLQIVREAGLRELVNRITSFAYRRGLRPLLPSEGPVHFSGVRIAHQRKFGDRFVPPTWRFGILDDLPDYESALVAGLKEYVRFGDSVVIVGGGMGVTATVAAQMAGPIGEVECFEGALERVRKVQRTAELNSVSDRLIVHHAIVGRSISVYGREPDHAIVAAAQLPECDVLELDCEGAEVEILREMTIRPRVILVETHGHYGASTKFVTSLLEGLKYSVIDRGIAEPRERLSCEENDIRVLIGVDAGEPAR